MLELIKIHATVYDRLPPFAMTKYTFYVCLYGQYMLLHTRDPQLSSGKHNVMVLLKKIFRCFASIYANLWSGMHFHC